MSKKALHVYLLKIENYYYYQKKPNTFLFVIVVANPQKKGE